MTVATSLSVVQLVGDGSTTAFPAAFPIFDQTHIEVYLGATLQTLTTHYTVSGVGGASFTVNFVTAPANGAVVTIQRVVPLTQNVDYLANDPFPAETHERALDLLTMEAQQIQTKVDRALLKPITDATALDMTLPAAATRAGKYLIFDGAGSPTVTTAAPIAGGDLDGGTLILDGDADTFMQAPVDDIIDFYVNGVKTFTIQAYNTTLFKDDSGPVYGPVSTIRRHSTTPVAQDVLGLLAFDGANSALDQVTYAHIYSTLDDPTAGAEDGILNFGITVGGDWKDVGFFNQFGFNVYSTDAGSGGGPDLFLYRDSASPVDFDLLGRLVWTGNNESAGVSEYAYIQAEIEDATAATAEGKLYVSIPVGGSPVNSLIISSAGLAVLGNLTFNNGNQAGRVYQPAAQATTSGTSKDFTGIPSWAKKIVVGVVGVSLSGTSVPRIQIGDSGGIENTDYSGSVSSISAAAALSDAFSLLGTSVAANVIHGVMELVLVDPSTNTWAAKSVVGTSNAAAVQMMGGTKSLSATLDRVRLTGDGVDTFDAGSVNILVMG